MHTQSDTHIRREERRVKHELSIELQFLEEARADTKNTEETVAGQFPRHFY